MAIKKKIKDLEAKIAHIKSEPGVNWLGKWAKSVQVKKLESKIVELNKELRSKNHSK